MKLKTVITTAVVLGIGGIGYAAFRYFAREKKLLTDYQITPVSFELLNVASDNVAFNFTLRLTNKSSIEATMKKMYSDIYLNEVFVGYVVNNSQAVIPANGSSDIKLSATFNPQIIFKNLIDIVLLSVKLKDVTYRLKGTVDLQSGFIPVSVPFEDSGKLSDFL